MVNIGQQLLARGLPTKRRDAEFSVFSLAALVPSAGTILIYNFVTASIAGAVGVRELTASATACGLKESRTIQRKHTMSPPSEHDQTRKFTDKSASIATETFEKGKAAMEQSFSATIENMRDFNLKLLDAARANADAVFDFARQVATVKEPSDLAGLWTTHAQKQFEMLSEQSKELAAFGQKIAGASVGPLASTVNQGFKKAS
jgi:hypothetical protein